MRHRVLIGAIDDAHGTFIHFWHGRREDEWTRTHRLVRFAVIAPGGFDDGPAADCVFRKPGGIGSVAVFTRAANPAELLAVHAAPRNE